MSKKSLFFKAGISDGERKEKRRKLTERQNILDMEKYRNIEISFPSSDSLFCFLSKRLFSRSDALYTQQKGRFLLCHFMFHFQFHYSFYKLLNVFLKLFFIGKLFSPFTCDIISRREKRMQRRSSFELRLFML